MRFLVWLSRLLSTRNENTAFDIFEQRLRGPKLEDLISDSFEVNFSITSVSPWIGVLELASVLDQLVEQQSIAAWHGGPFTHNGLGTLVRFESFEDARTAIAAPIGGVFKNWNR